MRKNSVLPLTIFFVLFSAVLFFLASTKFVSVIGNGLGAVTLPVQRSIASVFINGSNSDKQDKKLEVIALAAKSDDDKKEMQALRDQFETTTLRPTELLPARVIGFEGYIPGVTQPVAMTIDKGARDKVKVNQAVIYKDNLVGKVEKVTPFFSTVILLTNDELSFTANTLENKASGVIHGGKGGVVMDNIVLSEKINKGDIAVTKGDMTAQGIGFPPGLVIGEVVSSDKKQSDLFQKAVIKSLVDTSSLSTVFVLKAF